MADTLEVEDMQAIIIRGYGNLRAASYILLAIDNATTVRTWLSRLANEITAGQAMPQDSALNIAFTYTGLQKLGLAPEVIAMFSNEFISGMTEAHRSRILGDVGESAPEHWRWGGPTTKLIDLVLMLFATDNQKLSKMYDEYSHACTDNGLLEVRKLDTVDLGDKEHFGFRDGISQPLIEGLSPTTSPMHTIQAGEFILGYPNEYGLYTDRPVVAPAADPEKLLPRDASGSRNRDLGRNGSYLVFRQLRQDVRGFWQFLDQATRDIDGSSNPNASVKLASQMIGRWPSGAPLVKAPDQDHPEEAGENEFGYYQSDAHGFNCPIGAHIRRANPRDSLDPEPGSAQSIAIGKRHRLLRRGREYGKPPQETLSDSKEQTAGKHEDYAEQDQGLHFLCINANIARQFEFIQHTWVNNPKFDGLYDDADPVIGDHSSNGGTFTLQARPVRKRLTGLPRFVTVLGGAYFFLPGLKALRYLASPGR
jgi:Dyp-type peroxidase family